MLEEENHYNNGFCQMDLEDKIIRTRNIEVGLLGQIKIMLL